MQKEIIGHLSGHSSLNGNPILLSRWTSKERATTRSYLKALIGELGIEAKEHKYTMPNLNPAIDLLLEPFQGANIYAILPATNQSEDYVLLGAHYDTGRPNCPGAIDNATGISLAYSLVKQLSVLKERKKNVLLVFFDQEEEELIGSRAFAKFIKEQGLNIHSVHTFDMIGWDEDGNREIELELPTEYLERVYRKHAEKMNIPVYVTNINSTDHHSFRVLGFNAIGVNEAYGKGDSTPYKDTTKDTFETVNFDYLFSSTLFVFNVIKEIIS